MSYAQQDRGDVYSRVTAQIVAAIEAGAGTFEMPWHHDGSTHFALKRRQPPPLSRRQRHRPLGGR